MRRSEQAPAVTLPTPTTGWAHWTHGSVARLQGATRLAVESSRSFAGRYGQSTRPLAISVRHQCRGAISTGPRYAWHPGRHAHDLGGIDMRSHLQGRTHGIQASCRSPAYDSGNRNASGVLDSNRFWTAIIDSGRGIPCVPCPAAPQVEDPVSSEGRCWRPRPRSTSGGLLFDRIIDPRLRVGSPSTVIETGQNESKIIGFRVD